MTMATPTTIKRLAKPATSSPTVHTAILKSTFTQSVAGAEEPLEAGGDACLSLEGIGRWLGVVCGVRTTPHYKKTKP